MSFLFPFPENKDKENGAVLNIPGFFPLTALNSECLKLGLLSCPPNSAGATLHTYFPLTLC